MSEMDDVMVPINPLRCERCGERDRRVRLYENGNPKRLQLSWRLMPLHPECFRRWQGEMDLGLIPQLGRP